MLTRPNAFPISVNSWSRKSTQVTCAPSRRHTLPSSSPITPPPITTICAGTLASSSAPVESTIICLSLSTSTPGSGVTDDPVAMMIFLARRSEEHTSELQSLMRISYAVFCLKKKKTDQQKQKINKHITTKTSSIHESRNYMNEH